MLLAYTMQAYTMQGTKQKLKTYIPVIMDRDSVGVYPLKTGSYVGLIIQLTFASSAYVRDSLR